MIGPKRTALQPGELITAVTVPVLDGWQGYAKVGVRNAMVIATATRVPRRRRRRRGRARWRSARSVRRSSAAAEAEAFAAVDGRLRHPVRRPTTDRAEFGELAAQPSRPIDDHRSTADYRRHAVGVLARRLLRRAFPMSEPDRHQRAYTLHVNGETHEVRDAWVGESLLYVLRERLGLIGSKGACEQGECGSCSVLVDDELVCSCLVLAASAERAGDRHHRGHRPGSARRATCSRRSSTPARCSAGSARRA